MVGHYICYGIIAYDFILMCDLNIIPNSIIKKNIKRWIDEDASNFDFTAVGEDIVINATLYLKSSGIICGTKVVNKIFEEFHIEIAWTDNYEGKYVTINPREKIILATCTGKMSNMNLAERIALNFLQKCSGIATNAHKYNVAASMNPDFIGKIAATRKIIPGFGIFQKYAAIVGGCDSHRVNITDMVMIKDNHRDQAAIRNIPFVDYVNSIKKVAGFTKKIEIECRNIQEVNEAIPLADIIMLDNFAPDSVRQVSKLIKDNHPNIIVDISGGINLANLHEYLGPNIDVISISKVLDYDSIDISLKTNKIH